MKSTRYFAAAVFALVLLMMQVRAQDEKPATKPTDLNTISKSKDKPIYMLNVIWYKPNGGEKKYQEYLLAAGPIAIKHGAKRQELYIPEKDIIGDLNADLIFVVKWPNEKSFLGLISDPAYLKVSHLRKEAISKSLLIRCKKFGI